MTTPPIHNLNLSDIPLILQLNNAHAEETSHLNEDELCSLLTKSFYARGVDGGTAAFLIALDQSAIYHSPNFLWFKEHRRSFIYVDRIIVAATAQRQGLAQRLYADLFDKARNASHDRIVCEVNTHPPNPNSEAFHLALGFQVAGEATLSPKKIVRYYEKTLTEKDRSLRLKVPNC
jgi:predicted GNAT superfamily acetyltransferase